MKLYTFLKLLTLMSVFTSLSAQAYQLSGFKWDSTTPGTGASLTWGYAENGSDCRVDPSNCDSGSASDISTILPDGYQQVDNEVRSAFNVWSNFADVDFTFTNYNPDILISEHSIDGSFGILAQTTSSYYSVANEDLGLGYQSDIAFDSNDTYKLNPDDSSDDFFFNVLTHEIGHALGLSHVDDQNSLMYRSVSEGFIGPQADDIAGIQFLYGTGGDRLGLDDVYSDLLSDSSDVTAVPLPAAFWLMLSGCGVITAIRKRIS